MDTNIHVAWYPEQLPQAYREFTTVTWWTGRGRSLLTVGAPLESFAQMTLEEQAEAIGDAISRALRHGVMGGRITEFRSPSPSQ